MNGPIFQGYTQDQQLTTEDIIRRNARQWGHDPDQAVADYRREKAADIQMQKTEGPLASSQG